MDTTGKVASEKSKGYVLPFFNVTLIISPAPKFSTDCTVPKGFLSFKTVKPNFVAIVFVTVLPIPFVIGV